MKKNKKGFTLTEVLICIAIVGIIAAIGVVAVMSKVKNSYTSLSYFALKNLEAAMTRMLAGGGPTTHFNKVDIYEAGSATKIDSPLFMCKDSGAIQVLLKGNTTSATAGPPKDCSTVFAAGTAGQLNVFCQNLAAVSSKLSTASCSTYSDVNKSGSEPAFSTAFSSLTPNFTTSNGMKYYISKWDYDSTKVSSKYGYRLVAVDLNATKGPNSGTASVPDIVTFLILDNGEIFPLGAAADNKSGYAYIPSRVKGYYYDTNNKGGYTSVPGECRNGAKCNFRVLNPSLNSTSTKGVFTYREAYCLAHGYSTPYANYCTSKPANAALCSKTEGTTSGKRFDNCVVDPVKPLFRFKFK